MKFVYKIHSGYDGFRPAALPHRMQDRKLRLGWRHYIDVVEKGWECWVYFHGPHRFENGVYATGIVDDIDLSAGEVSLRVREYRTDAPIVSHVTSARVAEVVATRFRQVFLWPDDWTFPPNCEPNTCRSRKCDNCTTWARLPLIEKGESTAPRRLRRARFEDFVPAHWIVPRRCYQTRIRPEVQDLTKRFTEFKWGEMAYAYPFALSMFEQLRRRELLEFDYVVPIPLSPDKVEKGETHRTRELAKELGRLLAVNVLEMLSLSTSISKRRMQAEGYSPAQFEKQFREVLHAKVPEDADRILLIDDVITRGSTVGQALYAIRAQRPDAAVVVGSAGQMIVKEAVVNAKGFAAVARTECLESGARTR